MGILDTIGAVADTAEGLASDAASSVEGRTIFRTLKSEALNSASYNPVSMSLDLEFSNGSSYTFESVPPTVFAGLIMADSPGSFFHANIKGKY